MDTKAQAQCLTISALILLAAWGGQHQEASQQGTLSSTLFDILIKEEPVILNIPSKIERKTYVTLG
jgi:hypothetical protein